MSKTTLSRENNGGGTSIPDLKLYYRAITTKTMCSWKTGPTSIGPIGFHWRRKKYLKQLVLGNVAIQRVPCQHAAEVFTSVFTDALVPRAGK